MGKQYELIIIGAGPGGYVAAKKAAKLGMWEEPVSIVAASQQRR